MRVFWTRPLQSSAWNLHLVPDHGLAVYWLTFASPQTRLSPPAWCSGRWGCRRYDKLHAGAARLRFMSTCAGMHWRPALCGRPVQVCLLSLHLWQLAKTLHTRPQSKTPSGQNWATTSTQHHFDSTPATRGTETACHIWCVQRGCSDAQLAAQHQTLASRHAGR